MTKWIAALMLLASGARASMTNCTTAAGPLSLQIPIANVANGSQFSACLAYDFNLISTAAAAGTAVGTSTAAIQAQLNAYESTATARDQAIANSTGTTYSALNSTGAALTVETNRAIAAEALKVAKAGDTMTGALTVNASGASITASGGVVGSSGSFTNGVTASSGTFLATGAGQYSVVASSGIIMNGGGLKFPDGSIQYTKAGSGAGDVVASSSNSFTAGNSFTGNVSISSWTVSNLAVTGYAKVGPVLMEWGKYTGGANAPTITFPLAFSSIYSVVATCQDAGGVNGCMVTAQSVGTTSFVGNQDRHDATPITSNFYWLAIGQ